MEVRTTSQRQSEIYREEQRHNAYLNELKENQRNQDATVENDYDKNLQSLIDQKKKELESVDKAYKVELSHLKESKENELNELRNTYDRQTAELRAAKEKEFASIEKREHARTENFVKKQEEIRERIHAEHQDTLEKMRENGVG